MNEFEYRLYSLNMSPIHFAVDGFHSVYVEHYLQEDY